MAIFHLSAKIVSRSRAQSAVAKAAYNSRSQLENEKTGENHDYRYKGEVLFSGIFAPKNAPEWAKDRQVLWSAVEKRENRKNSQLAREIEIGLPHELTGKQREYLVKDFVRENFMRKGMVADVAIHGPDRKGDDRNYHAHILLTMREIGPEGFGEKMRHLNSNAQLEEWREKWEHTANRHLERHGHEARIDRRSFEAQGIDREPTTHVGPTATQFEREGVPTERGGINRQIEERNRQREQLKAQGKEIKREVLLAQRAQHAESTKDFHQHQEATKQDRAATRLEAAQSGPEAVAQRATLKHQARQVDRDADKGLMKIAPRLFRGATKALDGVLDILVGAPPETPEQSRAKAAEQAEREREAAQEKPAPPKTAAELEKELFERKFTSTTGRERGYSWERERERER